MKNIFLVSIESNNMKKIFSQFQIEMITVSVSVVTQNDSSYNKKNCKRYTLWLFISLLKPSLTRQSECILHAFI